MEKKILVCCLSDPASDPRPNRIINFLIDKGYKVDILSYKTTLKGRHNYIIHKKNKNAFLKGSMFLFQKLIKSFANINIRNKLNNKRFSLDTIDTKIYSYKYDYIFAHDLYLLPFLFDNFRNQKLIFDAREYYPKEFESSLIFNIFERPERELICKIYLSKCFKILTVSEQISQEYLKNFNVNPIVVYSAPYLNVLNPKIGIETKKIKIVHHGVANRDRKIENMINVVEKLGKNFSLDLVLVGNINYINRLKRNSTSKNINFLDPWKFENIIDELTKYDIGFHYVEPTTFNLRFGLGNKFFEFIHAGLAIAIGPSPEMEKLVVKHEIGIVADNFSIESMVEAFKNLTPEDLKRYKQNSLFLRNKLNAEVELEKILPLLP